MPAACAAGLMTVVLLAAGTEAGAGWVATGPEAAAANAKPPKQGVFRGLVGTTARISFRVRDLNLKKLAASVNTLCQRASDGFLTRFQLLAISLKNRVLQIRRRNGAWRFSAEGQQDNGVAWEVSGRFTRRGVAKGTFQASAFYLIFPFDSELCSGSAPFTARRQ
jgi:hypothetical protein